MKRLCLYLITALTPLATTPTLAADWVVLESTSPDIKAGSMTPGESVITLAADTQIRVIGPSGDTYTLAGPYTGPINAAHLDPSTGQPRRANPVGDFPALDPDYYK